MTENLFDQSANSLSLDETSGLNTGTIETEQLPIGGSDPVLPPNYLSQSSLYTDSKGKPLDRNPKARAQAANHLIQNKLPQPTSLEDLVLRNRAILNADPLLQSGATSDRFYRESTVRRYDDQDYGFIPGIDNDDFYGKREAWYETLGKGAFRLPTYVVTKTLQGAGFLAGLASPWNWGSYEGVVSKSADNALYKVMEGFDDWTKNEWMPTFQEAADRDKGFFGRMFTDGDFWAEDAVDGAAFMISAFIPGMVLSKLGLGAATMRGLGSLTRYGAAGLGTIVEGSEAVANYFTQAQRAAKTIDKFNTWALATASESMFEAKEVRDNVRNTLRDKIKADGTYYSEDEINKIAGDASRNTFLMNAALLGATNLWQMKYFGKAFGLGEKSAIKATILGGEGLASQAALSPVESALKYYGKILGGGIAREGFIEENMQLAIQRINERYGSQGKVSSFFELNNFRDLFDQYSTQTVAAIKGDDPEASMNIGLGGLLGGGSNLLFSRGERAQQKLNSEAALRAYTDAQENWLKFGNIYKTEEIKSKDSNGNDIISNRVVLDENNQPVIDEEKLNSVVTGIQTTSDMLTDADNTKNKYTRDYLRLSAFSEFVQAHINSGLESTLMDKLDSLKTASPEDLAKLGFVADENFQSDIEKHKSLASTIIKQNKILNESILFDNSREDKARKYFLTNLAAKQAVAKHQLPIIEAEESEVKNQFINSENSSLSDGMVDQLNQLLYRMEFQKELVDYLKTSGQDKAAPMGVYETLLEELNQTYDKLLKDNETTVSDLKKDKDGFYLYEKEERNDSLTRQFLDAYLQKKGQMLNEIKSQGLAWAFYADNKNGKNNFIAKHKAEVDIINGLKKKREEEEKKLKEEVNKLDNQSDKVNKELGIQEGKEYITQSVPESRVYKGRSVKTIVYRQDIIKIVNINDDSVSFTVNNDGEVINLSNEEFAAIGKLYPMDKLTPEQRIYFRNRNMVFDLNVRANSGKRHLILGPHANKDYSSSGVVVKARLELSKEEQPQSNEPVLVFDEETGTSSYETAPQEQPSEYILRVVYTNPVTGKTDSFEYNNDYIKKYGSNKSSLFDLTESEEEYFKRSNEKRRLTQIDILSKALDELIQKFDSVSEQKKENEQKYIALREELAGYLTEMDQIQQDIAKLPPKKQKGAKTKERKRLEEAQQKLVGLIAKTEDAIKSYKTEIENLQKELDTIEKIYEAYDAGITELKSTGVPYTRDQTGSIVPQELTQEINQLEQKNQIIKPKRNISNEKLDQMIASTEGEIAVLNERIAVLNDLLDRLNKLSKFDQVPDIVDALENIDDKQQLLLQLNMIKRQESNPDKKQIVQNVINLLVKKADSIETAYLFDIADRYGKYRRELNDILNNLQATEEKLLRLYTAKEDRDRIAQAKKRISMYDLIQNEIIRQYKIRRERAGVKQEGNKIIISVGSNPVADDLIKGPDAILTTQVIEDIIPDSQNERDSFITVEGRIPILSETALFKSAGLHFADLEDTELNSPEDARYFKFTEGTTLRNNNGTVYYFMPITKDSKEFQDLRITSWQENGNTVNYDDDIRLVVVKRDSSGVFRPVDVAGNILENPTKDNMIYTAMLGHPSLMSSDTAMILSWLKKNFVNKNKLSDNEALAIVSRFKKFRETVKERIKNNEPVFLPIEDKSPGIFNREPLGITDSGDLLPQELSLQGRLIENNPDFSNLRHPDGSSVKLTVSTFNGGKVRAGRLLMVKENDPNSSILVYNRKFNEQEHDNLINVLKRMAELFEMKALDLMSPDEDTEFQLGIKYLQGVAHWFSPKEGFAPYSFQMWVKNGLHFGNNKIEFTAESIENNRNAILEAVPYHKVNNTMLSDKKANNAFTEIKVIDGKIIPGTKYVNYQHYLLADREGGSIIYTNIKPYTAPKADNIEPQDYQLKNVYLKYGTTGILEEEAPVVANDAPKADVPAGGIKTYGINQSSTKLPNGDVMYTITNNIPKGPKLTFVRKRADGTTNLYVHAEYVNGKYKVTQIVDENGTDFTNLANLVSANEEGINSIISYADDQLLSVVTADKKNLQDDVISQLTSTFFSIEDFANKGNKVVTPTKVATVDVPVASVPVEDPKFDAFVADKYDSYVSYTKANGESPLSLDEFSDIFQKQLRTEYKAKTQQANSVVSVSDYKVLETFLPTGGNLEYTIRIQNNKTGEKGSYTIDNTGRWVVAKFNDKTGDYEIVGKPLSQEQIITSAKTALGKDFVNKLNSIKSETDKVVDEKGGEKFEKFLELLKKYDAELAALKGKTDDASEYLRMAQNAIQEDNDVDPNARVNNPEAVSKEDIAEFKEWMKETLPQFMVDVFDSLIDGRYMGQFYNGSVRLYENAEAGTGFHEAFEAVWNALLTSEQQQAMIAEYKNRPEWNTQSHYKWAVANYPYRSESGRIKEALAEEFRDYMLNRGANIKQQSPKRNIWFRKLWNFIKELLGLGDIKQELDTRIQSVFSKIASGGFKNQSILPSYDPTLKNNKAIKDTSVEFTQALMEGMTATFFDLLYSNDFNIQQLFDKNNKLFDEYYKKTYNKVFNTFNPGLKVILNNEKFQGESSERQTEEIRKYKAWMNGQDPLFEMKDAVLKTFNTEVKDQFKRYLTHFGLSFSKVKADDQNFYASSPIGNLNEDVIEELINKEELANSFNLKDTIYIDPTTLTNPSVRLLILSLTSDKQDVDGKVIDKEKNQLGLTSLVAYKRKMNILLNELSNIVPVQKKQADGTFNSVSALDSMVQKLTDKYSDPVHKSRFKPGFEWISKMLKRLKYDQLKEGQRLTDDELRLLLAFENAFNRNRNIPLKVIVGKDGRLRHVDAISVNTVQKIKEEWRSNVKDKALKSDINNLASADLIYINPGGFIEVNLQSKKLEIALNASNFREKLEALSRLGIKFSVPSERLSGADQSDIESAFNSMRGVLKDRKLKTIPFMYSEFFDRKTVEGPLNSLLAIEANLRSEDTLLSHLTPDGKTQYAITLPSEITNIINSMAGVETLEEFIASNPQYGTVNNGVIVLNPYQRRSQILKPGGLFFDAKGNKIFDRQTGELKTLKYEYIQGLASDQTNEGDNTDNLTFSDKITQEIYHIMRGTYFSIINSDKSSEFGINMGYFIKPDDINNIRLIEDKYLDALRDEVMHALTFHFSPNHIKDHQNRILMLGHFSGILGFTNDERGSKLQNYFNDLVKSTKVTKKMKRDAVEELYNTVADNFVSTVRNEGAIRKYINAQVAEHKQWLLSREIVIKDEATGKYNTLSIPADNILMRDEVLSMNDLRYDQLVTFLTVNRQLAVFEQHKLFYGHPALYKELAKRSGGANSQKNSVSENTDVINLMNQTKPRYDGRTRDTQHPVVKSLTYDDPEIISQKLTSIAEALFKGFEPFIGKQKAEDLLGALFTKDGKLEKLNIKKGSLLVSYANITESDGQSYIMPDYFRDLLYLSSSLTKDQEDLLNYENAQEIVDRNDPNHLYHKRYQDDQVQKAREILAQPKPDAVLQPLKPQGFGFAMTPGMTHVNMLKNSVFPLTWNRVKHNPTMLAKYIDAQNTGTDVINFISGHKVGAVTNPDGSLVSMYNQDGSVNSAIPKQLDIISKYVGIQVEIPSYARYMVIFGSQVRKIILSNLPKELEPFKEEYMAVIDELILREREQLLNELGLNEQDGVYTSKDLSKMMSTMREQAIRRGMPDNVIDMMDTYFVKDLGEQLKYPFDANPARERIEFVLQAMVDTRIIRMEMFGKSSVQVASTMWEKGKRNLVYLKNDKYEQVTDFEKLTAKEKKTVMLSSGDLKFYDGENGYMEVYIPWYFEGISPEKAGFSLKEGIWTPNSPEAMETLLTAIGFRIPTQGFNAIESIRIKGFLDPSYGDIVVVPSEIVGKSGTDFDIDKLNMFLANYKIGRNGELVYVKYSTSENELNERYINYVNRVVDEDLRKLMYALSADERASLRENFKKELDRINTEADTNYKSRKNSLYNDYRESKENLMTIEKDTDQHFKDLFASGKKHYWNLTDETRATFVNVKNHIIAQDIKGPREIQLYLEHAVMMRESDIFTDDNSTLDNMIKLYQEELHVLGFKQELIEKHYKNILDTFRNRKSELRDMIKSNKQLSIVDLVESNSEEMQSIYLDMAKEMARLNGLKSLEEFSKLPLSKQNSKKSLQNRLIEIMKSIIEHPSNRRQLLVPNSTARLKSISEMIISLRGTSQVENDMTKLSEWRSMAETRETFVTSKQLVGVGALQITSHTMAQIGEIELSGSYKNSDGQTKNVNIKLPNSNTLKLDLTIDSESQFIFDLLSETLSGSVDAAKDPFIYELRLNLETASTWFYLTKRGVSQENVALFFNQPAIDDFFKARDTNRTYVSEVNDNYLYFNEVVLKAAKKYYEQATGLVIPVDEYPTRTMNRFKALRDDYSSYKSSDMVDMIKNSGKLNKKQAGMQVAMLMDMLDYRDQANLLSNFIKGISYDTSRTKSMIENRIQKLRYNKMLNDGFITKASVDRVFQRSFLSSIKSIKDDIENMFAEFFVSLQPKTLPVFDPLMKQLDDNELFISNDDKADLINRYQSFILGYILQNTPYGKEKAIAMNYDLFQDSKDGISLPKMLKVLKERYPNNHAFKNLFPIINDNRNATDNIKLFNNKMSAYDINLISESLETLHTMAQANGDMDLQKFVDNLVKFTILQSGLQLSPITFTKVMPLALYADTAAKIFRSYTYSMHPIDVKAIWRAFHQNYAKNNNIVPTIKLKKATISNGLLILNRQNKMAAYDYVKVYVPKEGVTHKMLKDRAKAFFGELLIPNSLIENTDNLYTPRLFEKVTVIQDGEDVTDKKPKIAYRPINMLGNGMYVLETSAGDPITGKSRFETLNEKIDESLHQDAVYQHIEYMKQTFDDSDTPQFDKLPRKDNSIASMTYAGIGSRETPEEILNILRQIVIQLENMGFTVNTGNAKGADAVFRNTAKKKNVFYPKDATDVSKEIALEIHPNPEALKRIKGGIELMARNTNQIFGQNLDTPVDFVIAYDKSGWEGQGQRPESGGTNQAIDMAYRKGIPVINIANPGWQDKLQSILNDVTKRQVVKSVAKPAATSVSDKKAPVSVKGINIFSGSNDPLGAALTNPTHYNPRGGTSSSKGKLVGIYKELDKGIKFNGKPYKDVEEAYFSLRKEEGATPENIKLITDLEEAKLRQYPFLVDEITKRGGIEFLEKSIHTYNTSDNPETYQKKEGNSWTSNTGNIFLKTLIEAYKRVISTQAPDVMGVEREYTPENITSLKPNEVFVFGSNTEGRHGLGAALTAKQKFGAKQGQARGLQGQSYAIVTKDLARGKRSVSLDNIRRDISTFIDFAYNNPQYKFYVTKLGSDLAGYSIEEIKDVIKGIYNVISIPENVILPKEYEVRTGPAETAPVSADVLLDLVSKGLNTSSEVDDVLKNLDGGCKRG